MNAEQGFRGIPGVPEGWELVAIRPGRCGDWHINADGKPVRVSRDTVNLLCIIRKIEVPKQYRAFSGREEFERNRHRWWAWKDDRDNTFPPAAYGVVGHSREGWLESFERKVFDDGSPFGVEITSENPAG